MRSFSCSRLRRISTTLLVVGLFGLFRPASADASWAAMLPLTIASVRQAVDILERNFRIIEDQIDQAGGLVNAFSAINTAYRTVRGSLGLDPEPSRLGDLFRATLGEPECYLMGPTFIGSRPCSVHAILDATDLRDQEWLQPLFGILVGNPLDYWRYEELLHGPVEPGGVPWEGKPFPLPADPIPLKIAAVADYAASSIQAQRTYARGRDTQRRLASVKEYSRLAAEQVLLDPRRGGNVGDSFGTCLSGDPTTLLGAAMDADCSPAGTALGRPDPSGGPGAHENLSESEIRVLNVQVAIVETIMLAAELEQTAIMAEDALSQGTLLMDRVTEATRDVARAIQFASGSGPAHCLTYAYAAECELGLYRTRTRAQQQADVDFYATLH